MKFNKGAMFGLEARALKKQSGGLFLARLRRLTFRLVEGQQAIRVQTAKGAMFGLDARIALAIFGALSVISGAALYSAIKQAKIAQTNQRIIETAKSVEQFVLDTGQAPSMFNTMAMNISEIIENPSLPGWKGPYINYKKVSVFQIEDGTSPMFRWFLYKQQDTGLGGTTGSSSPVCDTSNPCGYWLKSHLTQGDSSTKFPNAEAFVLNLDEYIDGGDGDDKGNFRINWLGSDNTDPIIFYKVMPALSI
ncbi:MAG TPA: hypothetical protein DCL21_00715 [Alphaproteobacteria bacterium]|nr:hypothetical protein [Alphaproteobacteria bacterium]